MYWRPARDAELETCLQLEPRHLGDEIVGRRRAVAAWRWLLRSPSFAATAFVADPPIAGKSIVGFGASAFVASSFVDAELAAPRPGLNSRLIATIDAGRPIVLTREQLRDANTYDGLDLAVLAAPRNSELDQERLAELNYLIPTAFVQIYDGYRFSRIICEAVGTTESDAFAASGVARRVDTFDDRALWVITRESVLSLYGAMLTHLFQPHERVLRLREGDQQLLLAALAGATDEELSQQLKLSVGALKKRWETIFDRVSTVLPHLCPMTDPAEKPIRGRQKRHHILAYVREHPEELRPYDGVAKAPVVLE